MAKDTSNQKIWGAKSSIQNCGISEPPSGPASGSLA